MVGQEATAWLKFHLDGRTLSCVGEGRDRCRREAATCYLDGKNVNEMIVRSGWAFACRHYSNRYSVVEGAAVTDKTGIWAGKRSAPWDWRRSK